MRSGSRARPVVIALTTTILSDNARTVEELHAYPHTATATTTCTIYLAAMWCCFQVSGHCSWNQSRV